MKISELLNESPAFEKTLDEKKPIIAKGVKGAKSTPFTKRFKNWAAYDKWLETEEAGNYEVNYVMNEAVDLSEFAPGGNFKPPKAPPKKNDPWGNDDSSKIIAAVKRLLTAGNKVDWKVPGQMGHVVGVSSDGNLIMKAFHKPYSKIHYSLKFYDDRDDRYVITLKAPKHYEVVSAGQ